MPRDLRKLAEGMDCQVRVPEVCNHDSSTVVLAHVRMAGVSGISQKAPDVCGAWACSACHDYIDGRTHRDVPTEQRLMLHLEGVIRTLHALNRRGAI